MALMAEIGEVVQTVLNNAGSKRQLPAPEDRYENGLLVCGKCGGRKETWIQFGGHKKVVRCVCKCQMNEYTIGNKKKRLKFNPR